MKTIDLAKKVYDCFSKGDLPGVLSCLSNKIEWIVVGPTSLPYAGTYNGRAGVEAFFAKLFAVEEILEFHPEKFIDGGVSVVVTGRERCRTRDTGKEFSVQWAHLFESENGEIVRWKEFIDTAPMVEAYRK